MGESWQLLDKDATMRQRFMVRVLLPPFILLVIIGGIGFWQLSTFLRDQAVDELRSAAQTTAIRVEREVAIREVILKNTGQELALVKSQSTADLQSLEDDRFGCREYYTSTGTFIGAPNEVCEPFAQSGDRPSLAVIEDEYIAQARALQSEEIAQSNQRLAAFKQFFPETIAVVVTAKDNEVVSSAVSGEAAVSAGDFSDVTAIAATEPVKGVVKRISGVTLAVFAFPFADGSVLAAYDVDNPNYIRPSWLATPINAAEASAIIVGSGEDVVYPGVRNERELLAEVQGIEDSFNIKATLSGVENIVVAEPIAGTDWTMLVASPEAIVLSPARDTQLAAVIAAGVLINGFLWVGTFFIKRITDDVAQLVTGAMVYGSGRLDYKLDMKKSSKEFRQLAETMNFMARRIAQSEQDMDEQNKEFISIATHELRAPMTSIIGYLSMLKDELGTKRLGKQNTMLLDSVYDGTVRLRDLINDMLDAARLEGGREEFNMKKVKVSDVITECIEQMQVVAKQSGVKLEYKQSRAVYVMADEAKLRIILNNFLSNAIKYNHKKGYVRVAHGHHKGQVLTTVANSGPPIPPDQQAHMFEKFFRVDTPAHRKVTGTGMGMHVTKEYVEAMGGEIWFTSQPDEDVVFHFTLTQPEKGKDAETKVVIPKQSSSKWIMRWRRRMK